MLCRESMIRGRWAGDLPVEAQADAVLAVGDVEADEEVPIVPVDNGCPNINVT